MTEEIEEEDEEIEEWLLAQGCCAHCEERMLYAEDSYSLSICSAKVSLLGLLFTPLLLEGDPYKSRMFDSDCWEGAEEELRESKADVPPILDNYAILDCGVCECGIREDELLGIVVHGEVHRSQRNPAGEAPSDTFVVMDDDPLILCISCLHTLDVDIVQDLWDFRIAQETECEEGTFARCWRHGCSADGQCKKRLEETG